MKKILDKQKKQADTPKSGGKAQGTAQAKDQLQQGQNADNGIDKQLKKTNENLTEMRQELLQNFKVLINTLLGVKDAIVAHPDGREDDPKKNFVLDKATEGKPFKTYGKSLADGILSELKNAGKALFTPRGLSDLLFGAPEKGSARANGRERSDALKQYTKDRMMLSGPELVEQHGSTRKAKRAIADEFNKQQELKAQIQETQSEIKRRKGVGMTEEQINSDRGGKLLDKLNGLLSDFAAQNPIVGQHHTAPEIKTVPQTTPAPAEAKKVVADKNGRLRDEKGRFVKKEEPAPPVRARDEKGRFIKVVKQDLDPKKPAAAEPKIDNSEEEANENSQRFEKQLAIQEEQKSLLEKIAESVSALVKKSSDGEDKKDEPEGKGIFGDIIDAFKNIGPMIAKILPMIARLGSLVASVAGPALAVAGAGAAGVAIGTGINKAWEKATGNTIGNSLYNVFGEDDRVKDINKPVSKEELDAYRKQKAAQKLKTIPSPTGAKLEVQRQATEGTKNAADKAKVVNAPITVQNNVSNGGDSGGKSSPIVVRNQESTISQFVASRYIPRSP